MKGVRFSALRTGHLYSQEVFLLLISVIGGLDPQGHSATGKILSTPSGIKPATFRFVVHCQLRYYVPPLLDREYFNLRLK